MLTNYFKVAMRSLVRHKLYTTINIVGLSVGIACCVLIMLFVRNEWSYDSFNTNASLLYRIESMKKLPSGEFVFGAFQPMPLVPALKAEIPEIERAARFSSGGAIITAGENSFAEGVMFTDPDLLRMFDIEFLMGDPASALRGPNDVVLNAEMAKKYFGTVNAVGKQEAIGQASQSIIKGLVADSFDLLLYLLS